MKRIELTFTREYHDTECGGEVSTSERGWLVEAIIEDNILIIQETSGGFDKEDNFIEEETETKLEINLNDINPTGFDEIATIIYDKKLLELNKSLGGKCK